ncbi:hypothetical protein GCM10027614_04540 [Micromonospora vulcania]
MQAWFNGQRFSTLQGSYSAQQNAFGALRLAMACGVVIAHAGPLGFGEGNVGATTFGRQSDLGTLCLYGFSSSPDSSSPTVRCGPRCASTSGPPAAGPPRLWACLLVTAFVLAPLAALYENGNLNGFWGHPEGPFDYFTTNMFASMEQFPISGLLADTPYGQVVGGPSAFDGSLWTLRYDLAFYGIVGILVVTSVLRRSPRAVLVMTAICYALILRDFFDAPTWSARPPQHGAIGPFPLIGAFAADWTLMLGFLFLLGAAARLYAHRLPIHNKLAMAAGVVLVLSLWRGGFFAVGLPAFAYLVLFAAVALPKRLSAIGRKHDYTYGIYIYGFPAQQMIALLGGTRFGMLGYIVLSLLGTLLLAVPSWHLVERPALGFKTGSGRTRRRSIGVTIPGQALPILHPPTVRTAKTRFGRLGRIGRRDASARHSRITDAVPTRATAARRTNWSYQDTVPFLSGAGSASTKTVTVPTEKALPLPQAQSGGPRHARPEPASPPH